MNIAIVGCGYVAEFYGKTLANYPNLTLCGAYDRNNDNLEAFCRRWPTRAYTDFRELIDDSSVEMVLNLTNPRSHFEITKACLEADKHVYSEKPLAMEFEAARTLVDLAKTKAAFLGAAPCSVLGQTAQAMWNAIREGSIGRVRLVYANFDDGMIAPKLSPWTWRNEAGVPWPAKDEFEVGCTYEHAGYVLTWLAAFFGPALNVSSFASCQLPEKGVSVDRMAPDFTVGCIEYPENIVARVTCSLVAPTDKSLTIIGDDGVIFTRDVRNDASPVYLRRIPSRGYRASLERRVNALRRSLMGRSDEWYLLERYPLSGKRKHQFVSSSKRVDFCRGPAEMVESIVEDRPCRLSAELALHITELIEALQFPERFAGRKRILSSFPSIHPVS